MKLDLKKRKRIELEVILPNDPHHNLPLLLLLPPLINLEKYPLLSLVSPPNSNLSLKLKDPSISHLTKKWLPSPSSLSGLLSKLKISPFFVFLFQKNVSVEPPPKPSLWQLAPQAKTASKNISLSVPNPIHSFSEKSATKSPPSSHSLLSKLKTSSHNLLFLPTATKAPPSS